MPAVWAEPAQPTINHAVVAPVELAADEVNVDELPETVTATGNDASAEIARRHTIMISENWAEADQMDEEAGLEAV